MPLSAKVNSHFFPFCGCDSCLLPAADSEISNAHILTHQISKNAAFRLSFSFTYLTFTFKTPQNSISLFDSPYFHFRSFSSLLVLLLTDQCLPEAPQG